LLEDPAVWADARRAQELGKERRELETVIGTLTRLDQSLRDARELFDMAKEEGDDASLLSIDQDAAGLEKVVAEMEFRRMFSNPMDPNNCFLDIQAGSGGTEAQDWAAMLRRMYVRYAERHGFKVEVLEESEGEVAGIKSASLKISGDYAFGYLRTESGVHRLVRKSPFDSGNRRHTSFSSVFVYPEVDDSIEIEINPADLRVDTFRASGAGGQHINKTDSAIRITHLPTNIVVQCQNDRSQHRNRAEAMAMLKARLFELEMRKRTEEKQAMEDSKTDIGWGHQIRSYVLDQSRIKDLRTNYEVGNTQAVLDGDLDGFIEASLKQGV
jgi:peptide chain release factor 2